MTAWLDAFSGAWRRGGHPSAAADPRSGYHAAPGGGRIGAGRTGVRATFGGAVGCHAASRNTAANSSGRDQRDTVDSGLTSRKSSSVQMSAASSNSEMKVRAFGPAAR